MTKSRFMLMQGRGDLLPLLDIGSEANIFKLQVFIVITDWCKLITGTSLSLYSAIAPGIDDQTRLH